ncbi:MAG: hypothetical protein ACRDSE_21780, partial [Pseudonocardiaceae bacterium]
MRRAHTRTKTTRRQRATRAPVSSTRERPARGINTFEVNHEIRRVDGTTRFELFAAEEAPVLAALPDEPFEQVEWKELKVGRNYHLTADYQHYST